MVWELQGSKSAGEYYVHLAKFNTNYYPDVKVNVWFIVPRGLHIIVHYFLGSLSRKAYLEQIPKEQWVHYAQVAQGAHTYGWRTSNLAEIGMAFAKK